MKPRSTVRTTRPELWKASAEAAVERVFTELGLREIALRPLSEICGGQRQMVGLKGLTETI
jgi:iron complex transport system ATP-binding protein